MQPEIQRGSFQGLQRILRTEMDDRDRVIVLPEVLAKATGVEVIQSGEAQVERALYC